MLRNRKGKGKSPIINRHLLLCKLEGEANLTITWAVYLFLGSHLVQMLSKKELKLSLCVPLVVFLFLIQKDNERTWLVFYLGIQLLLLFDSISKLIRRARDLEGENKFEGEVGILEIIRIAIPLLFYHSFIILSFVGFPGSI
jgi:hypothetical protein